MRSTAEAPSVAQAPDRHPFGAAAGSRIVRLRSCRCTAWPAREESSPWPPVSRDRLVWLVLARWPHRRYRCPQLHRVAKLHRCCWPALCRRHGDHMLRGPAPPSTRMKVIGCSSGGSKWLREMVVPQLRLFGDIFQKRGDGDLQASECRFGVLRQSELAVASESVERR